LGCTQLSCFSPMASHLLRTVKNGTIDYKSKLSKHGRLLAPSPIRALYPLLSIPGTISLGGGMPSPKLFPIKNITVELSDLLADTPTTHRPSTILHLSPQQVQKALQYSNTSGFEELVAWLKEWQKNIHKLHGWENTELCVTGGSQEGVHKAFNILLDEGDSILVENPTYTGALAALRPLRCDITGVDIDAFGMIPEKLEELLQNWPSGKPLPKALYTIPVGQNPSGCTMTTARKNAIYQITSKYNILILEDDPYYNLQFVDSEAHKAPSFLSIDSERRVLRFDSFSKLISSGLRIGWVTGPKELVDVIQLHQQSSALHTSGVSQAILFALLEHWGSDGLLQHIRFVQNAYRQKRDLFFGILEKHLKEEATWFKPSAGMFAWLKLNHINDTDVLIATHAIKKKVLLLPGSSFSPNGQPSGFVRASYSTASESQMEEAILRFKSCLLDLK